MQHEVIMRRVGARPGSVDKENRTAELVISTGAGVERRDFEGIFIERLALSPESVDLGRLEGAPVLDSHRQDGLHHVLGVVESVTFGECEILAKVRFREIADTVLKDIAAGLIRGVSVGYSVQEWAESVEGTMRVRTAIRWTPHEVSIVPVPADPGATVRQKGLDMPQQTTGDAPAQIRVQTDAEIRTIAATANLDDAWIETQIDAEATPEQARAAAFEAIAERSGPDLQTETTRVEVGPSHDDPAIRAQWMGEAMYARINPSHQLSEPARQYAGLTFPEIARESLRLRGVSTMGLGASSLIARSLHTTSDFSTILGDTVGRTLRAAYESAPAGIKQLAAQTTAPDFRTKHRIMLGEAPTLQKVNEHGEFTSGTMAEAKESYRLETFGRIFGISRQALVNDDLGAFTDLSRRLGIAAADFEIDQLVALLESNPAMDDTKALFHADHGNVAGSGATIGEAPLSAARLAMRQQTGVSGKRISVVPRHVLVPAELETVAEKQMTEIQARTISDVNPFSVLGLVVESRLTDAAAWYVQAANVDGLEYAYLEGEPGPQIESRNGFEIDGVQVKVRLDFGAGFVDHRSWFMNQGAS